MAMQERGLALLAEDDPFMQRAVREFLEELGYSVRAATTYEQAREHLDQVEGGFRLCVVDMALPRQSESDGVAREPLGLQLVGNVKRTMPSCGVVVWSAYTHFLSDVIALVAQGHRGLAYVPKGSRARTLRQAIDRVLAGDVYFHSNAVAGLPAEAERVFVATIPAEIAEIVQQVADRYDELSARQRDVMDRIAYRPDVIAEDLGLELRTIRNYQDALYDRLGLKDSTAGTQRLRRDAIIVLATVLLRLRQGRDGDD